MKSNLVFLLITFFSFHLFGQVGIGTISPNAQLDIRAGNQATPSALDGVLLPKVDTFPTGLSANQDAMLVYLTTTAGVNTPGFYYWSNGSTSWLPIGDGAKRLDDLTDAKTDSGDTSVYLGTQAGTADDDTNNQNVGIGFEALGSNTSGANNVAVGTSSLSSNIGGVDNTAIGINSLRSNRGSRNTAIGAYSLQDNDFGSLNTAVGYGALMTNDLGRFNTSIGYRSLVNNDSGDSNVAMGYDALGGNTQGDQNVALGTGTLLNNVSSSFNTAVGTLAMVNKNNGNLNTAVGFRALGNLLNGTGNIAIGYDAQVQNSNGSFQIRMGNTNVITASIQVPWTITSDARWKDQIRDIPYGLNMINALRPVDYVRFNNEKQTREIGFIAQDVREVLDDLDYEDQGFLTADDNGYLSLRYNDLIPVLVKALQEQQLIITSEREKLAKLQAEMLKFDKIEARLKALETNSASLQPINKK